MKSASGVRGLPPPVAAKFAPLRIFTAACERPAGCGVLCVAGKEKMQEVTLLPVRSPAPQGAVLPLKNPQLTESRSSYIPRQN